MDYAHGLVKGLVQQVKEAIRTPGGMEPDEPSSTLMMCNLELLWVIGRHVGVKVADGVDVADWKEMYLAVWDGYIDKLSPRAGYKEERRTVIVETFDRLIELCRERER